MSRYLVSACSSVVVCASMLLVVGAGSARAASYVVAWGDNTYNQADVPPGLTNVVTVAGNNEASFALREDGTVAAWGVPWYGQTAVPPSVTNAVGLSTCYYHALALRNDGTVAAWGGYKGESDVPVGLTNAVAVAAGAWHSVALSSSGTITAWGYNCCGETNAPVDLTNAVGIAAGNSITLAIRADGSLLKWGGGTLALTVPTDLTNVASIAAGDKHIVAVQSNGVVRAWGEGPTNVPPDLTNVVAIATSSRHSLAIQADHTLVAWGENKYGQSTIPPNLTNVIAVGAGGNHSLAVVQRDDGSPVVVRHPLSKGLNSGYPVTFCAAGEGDPAPVCLWQLNGQNIAGATNPCLTIPAAQSKDAGTYRALLSNGHGTAISLEATLTVTNAPPVITLQPTNQNVYSGSPVTLGVAATGSMPMAYQWWLNGVAVPGATNPALVFPHVQLANEGQYIAVISNSWGSVTSSVAVLNVADLGDALNTDLVWISAGDAPWFPENQYSGYFTPVARSGAITHNQSSILETSVSGPGTLSFDWKVSSQLETDYLSFVVNGSEQERISGTTYFQTKEFYLGSGMQKLQWIYTKGASGGAGQDAGWVDRVTYTNGATLPVIASQPLHQAFALGSDASFSISAYGSPPLSYQWQLNGMNIAGATNASLTVINMDTGDAGTYRVIVSNPFGFAASTAAELFHYVGPSQPANALGRWFLRSSYVPKRVRFVGGQFVGVGANGLIVTSPDGTSWTQRVSGTTAELRGVAYGGMFPAGRVFVAVGSGGTILTSPDGITWNRRAGSFPDIYDVANNGNRFVAATRANSALDPNVLYSSDSTSWAGAVLPNKYIYDWPFYTHTVGVVGPYFIATGSSLLVDDAWRSADGGVTWQPLGSAGSWVTGIASSNVFAIMVGEEGWPRVSTNAGASWFASTSSLIDDDGQPPIMVGKDITYGNGLFLVSRVYGERGLLATDGFTWVKPDVFAGASLVSVAYGNGTFVTVCSGGSYPAGIYQSAPVTVPFLTIARQTNAVALSISGEVGRAYRLQASADLETWNDRHSYTNSGPVVQFVDPVPAGSTQLFYRAVSP